MGYLTWSSNPPSFHRNLARVRRLLLICQFSIEVQGAEICMKIYGTTFFSHHCFHPHLTNQRIQSSSQPNREAHAKRVGRTGLVTRVSGNSILQAHPPNRRPTQQLRIAEHLDSAASRQLDGIKTKVLAGHSRREQWTIWLSFDRVYRMLSTSRQRSPPWRVA
jgi:hypothetical protein